MNALTTSTTHQLLETYVMPTYGRFPISMARGKGTEIWDEEGKRYLDFCTGIAVCSLGHASPVIQKAIQKQAAELIHCSNLYGIRAQAELAKCISDQVVEAEGKTFFCNSGAEANEAMVKLARKFGAHFPKADGTPRTEILTFDRSFHGRTMAGISATGQEKMKEGFSPLLPGFQHLPFNDIQTLTSAINENTVAIMLEPVQGEGGIHVASKAFLQAAAALAKEHKLLLLFDEVQCGVGRTGDLSGWKTIDPDIEPDAVSWAKGIGGGIPIGCMWAKSRNFEGTPNLSDMLSPGTHGSTFGGNPLSAAVSLAVLKAIIGDDLANHAKAMGHYLTETLLTWKLPAITEVRGLGLMLGIVLDTSVIATMKGFLESGKTPSIFIVSALNEAGLLTVPAGPDTIRLLPPLNVTREEAAEALQLIKNVLTA